MPDAPRSRSRSVVELPKLPATPPPPRFPPDPRQSSYERIRSRLGQQIDGDLEVRGANLIAGFPASAVNLGALQDALLVALGRFTRQQLERRWRKDVRAWVQQTTLAWVQRPKRLTVTLRASGVHLRLETQDDRGYYRYELDIFPGR